jgi:aryl-alcohol dehydrogenase-like predicted oxidoreductase
MDTRALGDAKVGAIGLGEMPMSIEGRPDEARSVATIHAALDAGVTLIDTADAYHVRADEVGHGETLVAKALRSYGTGTSHVVVATKGGHLRPGDGRWTAPPHTSRRRARRRCGVSVSTRSGCTSTTGRTGRCRTPSR